MNSILEDSLIRAVVAGDGTPLYYLKGQLYTGWAHYTNSLGENGYFYYQDGAFTDHMFEQDFLHKFSKLGRLLHE